MRIFIIDYARKMRFVELTLINKSVPRREIAIPRRETAIPRRETAIPRRGITISRRGMDLSAIYNPFSYWLFKGFKRKDMKERGTSGRDYFVE